MALTTEDFCKHWQNLVGDSVSQVSVVLAFSGGVDSMTLLDLLVNLPENLRPQLHLAYFNHQLRADSAAEEIFVRAQAEQYQLPLTVGHWSTRTIDSEAAARKVRYEFLSEVLTSQSADYLLTAHHADDLLETIFMKLIRSGAVGELPGLKAQTSFNGHQLLRPLLPYSKQQLYRYAKEHQLRHIEDQTNQTDFTLRNRLRHHFIPALKIENSQLLAHSQRFADEMVATQSLAARQIQTFLKEMAIQQSPDKIVGKLPQLSMSENEWQLLWSTLWQTYLPKQPRPNLGQLRQMAQLSSQPSGNHRLDLGDHWQFLQSYDHFAISHLSPDSINIAEKQKEFVVLELDQWHQLPEFHIGVFRQLPVARLGEIVGTFQVPDIPRHLILRHPAPEDTLILSTGQRQKLRRRLINSKVPADKRESLWLLQADDLIIWVENIYNYKLSNASETAKIIYVLVDH